MDILHLTLQVAFFTPILARLLSRQTPATTCIGELGASLRNPALLAHEIGILLVWVGFALGFWTGAIDRRVTWAGVFGALILAAATLLMARSIIVLRSWRLLPEIDSGHELCTKGPYRFVRHPIYLALDLLGFGSAIAVPNVFVIIGAVLLVTGGDLRARNEERALAHAFGDQYQSYMRRVRRTIPGIY
jgi:protein-S-isoprenylcysteine O-methyltransferase Ste14